MNRYDHLRAFCLIIGNARSGSTLVGTLLDAHPRMAIANESVASQTLWRDLDRRALFDALDTNARLNGQTGRMSEEYSYVVPGAWNGRVHHLEVIGDKIWNPATLLLHGDHGLLPRLQDLVQVPLFIIHSVRNPFDTITTMTKRSGASIADRTRWFFMHCDAVSAIAQRWPSDRFLTIRHEDLLENPATALRRACSFLGQDITPEYVSQCASFAFATPKRTRGTAPWDPQSIADVTERLGRYSFLSDYSFET